MDVAVTAEERFRHCKRVPGSMDTRNSFKLHFIMKHESRIAHAIASYQTEPMCCHDVVGAGRSQRDEDMLAVQHACNEHRGLWLTFTERCEKSAALARPGDRGGHPVSLQQRYGNAPPRSTCWACSSAASCVYSDATLRHTSYLSLSDQTVTPP